LYITYKAGDLNDVALVADASVLVDADGDGSPAYFDCDDNDPDSYPGATEICDNADNNCNGSVDEGLLLFTYYQDADGDGYGNVAVSTTSCAASVAGYVSNNTDCNDQNGAINPAATEICDGVDNNCNGSVDEGLSLFTYYQDADGDGYGNAAVSTTSCATSVAGYVSNQTDCNDQNGNIKPGASEICDGVDNNCNGFVNEGLPQFTFYQDADGDGYGNAAMPTTSCATSVAGYVSNAADCNDQNGAINPAAPEICDGVNNNCNGAVDEGLPQFTFYQDADGDSYGNAAVSTTSCATSVAGYVSNDTDCNDQNENIKPGASEICDGVDNNCNGSLDEGLPQFTYYQDADGDGYGNIVVSTISCATSVAGYVSNHTDCNDQDGSINPGVSEICDDVDNNCNGSADEGLPEVTFYLDADGDGYGDAASSMTSCEGVPPDGFVTNGLDCDDTNNTVYPEAPEICDDIDNNCNELADENLTFTTYYEDADDDGYGNTAVAATSCTGIPPANFVTNDLDCDDTNNTVYPEAPEICDGIDNNCNELIDDGLMVNTYYEDTDGDSYGNASVFVTACEEMPPPGFVIQDGDCDDTDPNSYPGAMETPDNGIDENCDGIDSMTTAVKALLFAIHAEVYPNPTGGQVQVLAGSGELTLRVYDLTGALVLEQLFTEKTSVDLSDYGSGVYLFQIVGEQGLWMGKVLRY
jgi:Putative metal-binding motif/Secretion system C-terminal sorting domain